ncbi:MAG: MTH1187 family thiamine-binding protein [Candidatus Methanodesulfokora sp.]
MPLIVEVAVDPIGTGSPSVGDYIRAAVEVLRKRGMKHWIGPMGTSFEVSSLRELGCLLQEIHDELHRLGVMRIVTTVRIDDRRDKEIDMEYKVRRVQNRP